MVLTNTSEKKKNIHIKNFYLLEVFSWEKKNLKEFFFNKITVIMFICNHCPYVKHISKELIFLYNDYFHKDIAFLAINSNDEITYPEDSPKYMKETNYPFPYFFDETQDVAKYYNARCTPEFFIFSRKGVLYYCGQLDSSRPGNNIPVTGNDIRFILNKMIKGKEIKNIPILKKSTGCSIKWKKN